MTSKVKKAIGRPKRGEALRKIYVRESTFNLWMTTKKNMGFEGSTNSEFAEILIHRGIGEQRYDKTTQTIILLDYSG